MFNKKNLSFIILSLIIISITFLGCSFKITQETAISEKITLSEDEFYTSKDNVSLFIHTYNKLPSNFIKKKDAINLGWINSEGNLWDITDNMSIGGDSFGNRENLLPYKKDRKWYECDIEYNGGYRNSERIVFSNDGLIYYTNNHYESFEQLY